MLRPNIRSGKTRMPVYQFICKKHGGFEKITIRAEWDDTRCPKCGAKSKVDQKCKSGGKNLVQRHPG
jgi:putative FmdB family regulatory protein